MFDTNATFTSPDVMALAPQFDPNPSRQQDPSRGDLPSASARPVVPRRKGALSPDLATTDSRGPRLFDSVFDPPDAPCRDPRLWRSRQRARDLLAAQEARLAPFERNLWRDDDGETDPAATPTSDRRRRPVRPVKLADLRPMPSRPAPPEEPLHICLAKARDALYAPLPDAPIPAPNLPQRLSEQTLNLCLVMVALPLGALLILLSLLRGGNLALTARIVGLVGIATAVLQQSPFPLI